jgi:hypothetical protein
MDERSEELWARLVAGELDADSAEVREQGGRDPAFRDAVDEAGYVRDALARAGRARDDVIRSAVDEIGARDVETARAFVRASAAPPPRRRAPWLRIAAAASIALALIWFGTRPETPDGGTGPLSTLEEGDAFPDGRVSNVRHLQIPEELRAGDEVRFQVYDNAAPGGPKLLFESPWLKTRRWDLNDEQAATLPPHIRWHYDRRDTGGEIPGRWFEAELED